MAVCLDDDRIGRKLNQSPIPFLAIEQGAEGGGAFVHQRLIRFGGDHMAERGGEKTTEYLQCLDVLRVKCYAATEASTSRPPI